MSNTNVTVSFIFRPNTTKRKWQKQLCHMKDGELLIILLAPGMLGYTMRQRILAEIWATNYLLDLQTEIPLVTIVCRSMK